MGPRLHRPQSSEAGPGADSVRAAIHGHRSKAGDCRDPPLRPLASSRPAIHLSRSATGIKWTGSEELRVYATPEMVRDIEITCRELLLKHLDAGEDLVGTHVEVYHTGATPLGEVAPVVWTEFPLR